MAPWELLLVIAVQLVALGLLMVGVAFLREGPDAPVFYIGGAVTLAYPVLDVVVLITSWPMDGAAAVRFLVVAGVLVVAVLLKVLRLPMLLGLVLAGAAMVWLAYQFASGGLSGPAGPTGPVAVPHPTPTVSSTFTPPPALPPTASPAGPSSPGGSFPSAPPAPAPTVTVEVTVTAVATATPNPVVTVAGPTVLVPGPAVTVAGPTVTTTVTPPQAQAQAEASSDVKGWIGAIGGLIGAILTGAAAMYTAVKMAPRHGRHGPGGSGTSGRDNRP
ncbi:hypothetical protein [Kitasatospora sp. NPDC093806]|uniref:hypothetical protein n=1 Tax=Kitasatospora sp. NPDC093806 TaxID=3155075 RepID=UPI0034164004